MKDPVIYIEADWAAKVARLEARCDELNEACNAKQALLDHVAADERDFMELVEGYKRERDAEHLSRLSSDEQMRFQIKRAEGLQAEVERLNEQASGEGLHATGCACRYCAKEATP